MPTLQRGFTMIELMIIIVFVGLLAAIAVRPFGAVRDRFGADQGRLVFESLHARARAQAIESGTTVRLFVDTAADTVSISRGSTVLETVHFDDELATDIVGSSITVCLGPRGYAVESCNSFTTPVTLEFDRGGKRRSLDLLPLGQLVK